MLSHQDTMGEAHVAGTDPYPWPYDGCLDPTQLAFVICGAQRQLADLSFEAGAVGDRIGRTAQAVRAAGGSVIWIRHGDASPRHRPTPLPVSGSVGWQICIPFDAVDVVIDSIGWDGCFGSSLDHTLRAAGTRTIAMAGFATEITVDSTVRTLNDQGHECLVLTDGCAPLDQALGARAHHSLTMSGGIFGALGTTTALVDLLESLTLQETSA